MDKTLTHGHESVRNTAQDAMRVTLNSSARENEGTEMDNPSPRFGICPFHESYL